MYYRLGQDMNKEAFLGGGKEYEAEIDQAIYEAEGDQAIWEDGFKEGEREVVEWVEEHSYLDESGYRILLGWQAKLKEWGIE